MTKNQIKILFKNSATECNKKLLTFLHANIGTIRKKYDLKAIIIKRNADKQFVKKNNITKLPAMVFSSGNVIESTPAIKDALKKMFKKPPPQKVKTTNSTDNKCDIAESDCDDLNSFWNKEMMSDMQEEDRDLDLISGMRDRANKMADDRNKSLANRAPKKKQYVPPTPNGDGLIDNVDTTKIADFTDDPMLKKFWENQETTNI